MTEALQAELTPCGTPPDTSATEIDFREALFNGGDVGRITDIQVSTQRITAVDGILFDIDGKLLQKSSLIPEIPADPAVFYERVVKYWLQNHSVLSKAEVRNSGTGLHAILRLKPARVIESDQDRIRLSGIIQVVQAALPIDPDQPGITAVTRPIDSINSKNGAHVTRLAAGQPVDFDEIMQLYREMKEAPFRTLLQTLAERDFVAPCPICGKDDSRLTGLARFGQCYGSCGRVSLNRLCGALLKPRTPQTKDSTNDAT